MCHISFFIHLERELRQRGLPDYGAGMPVSERRDTINDDLEDVDSYKFEFERELEEQRSSGQHDP